MRWADSLAGHPQNAEEETREHGLKTEREQDGAWDHDAERDLGIERAKVVPSPRAEDKHPGGESRGDEKSAEEEADFEGDVAEQTIQALVFGG